MVRYKRTGTKNRVRRVPSREEEERLAQVRALVAKRSLKQEKEFPEYYHRGCYAAVTRTYKLGRLIGQKSDCNADIVREFYAQAAVFGLNSEFEVRDARISLSLREFRMYLRLPEVRGCQYKHFKEQEPANLEDEIAKALDFKGRTAWQTPHGASKYLGRDQLTVEARIWMHFIKNYIWPSTHTTRVTRDEALLIYLFKQEKPVDVGLLIYNSLTRAVADQDSSIILPHLITSFCQDLMVPELEEDLMLKPKPPFKYTSIKSPWDTYRQQPPHSAPENTAGEKQPPPPADAEPSQSDHPQPSAQEILALLQEIKGDIASTSAQCMTALKNFDQRLERIEASLAEHFQDRARASTANAAKTEASVNAHCVD